MISLTLTNVKNFMSHLLLKETFDNFSFIEGEIITFNTFRIDGYMQKDFFDSEEEIPEYSLWKNLREFCFSLIKGKKTPLGFHFVFSLNSKNISRLIEQKDYIKHPKENGYRSLHLIVAVPIFLQNEKREMKVEVQLRTIAMDFWASLEHKVRYKKNVPADETERLAQELSECAQISADLDQRMQNIRTRLADAELQHPQKQKKDEQILLDVLGL